MKPVNTTALREDGIIELYPISYLVRKGILRNTTWDNHHYLSKRPVCNTYRFANVSDNPGMDQDMIPLFGKVVSIHFETFEKHSKLVSVRHNTSDDYYYFPIECVKR